MAERKNMKTEICVQQRGSLLSRESKPPQARERARVGLRLLGGRFRAFLCSGSEGGSLVETALVMPLLLLLLTGMFSITMALYSYQQLGYATFSAAQQVGAGRGLLADPCNTVATAIPNGLTGWTAAKFTYTVIITDSSGAAHTYGPTTGSSFSCTGGAAFMSQNEPVQVIASYAYTWIPGYDMNLSGSLITTETVLTD
jgi:Flp pilus assembly protein TadG